MRLILETRTKADNRVSDENFISWSFEEDTRISTCTDSGRKISADFVDGGMGEDDGPEIILTERSDIKAYLSQWDF
jgi:hypothetical protein